MNVNRAFGGRECGTPSLWPSPGLRVLVCVLAFLCCPACFGRTIYVDEDADGSNDGTTWEQAYRDLQSALDMVQAGDEIRVAGGTYRPPKGLLVSKDARYATFYLISGVAVQGGFAGTDGADPNERDPARFESILSGDRNGDDANGQNQGDNCFHVVTGDHTDPNAVLDGFVIEGGVADGTHLKNDENNDSGGGLTIDRGSPTIINCTFRRNSAKSRGGAVEIDGGEPRFSDCVFTGNSVNRFGDGGAVCIEGQSHSEFTRCRFVANLATDGGAVMNQDSTVVFQNCLFAGNRAYYYRLSSLPLASQTIGLSSFEAAGPSRDGLSDLLTRRGGDGFGGAIYSAGGALTLISCTVADNSADVCGGISSWSVCKLVNCILWNNNDVFGAGVNRTPQIWGGDNTFAFYCCIQRLIDSLPGMGNIDIDPAFARSGRWADPDDPTQDSAPRYMDAQWIDGDYHLQSRGGRWDPDAAAWVEDEVNSPCIDSGDPNSPVGDEPPPNGGRINRGIYGGTAEASKSRGRTVYVDDDAPGNNDGTTWKHAYHDLQSALDVAQAGDEIRVAAGTYRPSKGLLVFASVRYATFSLISGVALRGGYAGTGGSESYVRNVARFESILSGDLDGDDADGEINGDNCFHVVTGDHTDPNAVLDGFTIEGGAGGGWSGGTMSGGGLTIYQGSPTIVNCTFRRNYAQDRGGAVESYQASAAFIHCTFVENTASWAGGAVEVYAGEPRFTDCAFIRNKVDGRNHGGAVFITGYSRPQFTRCRFVANLATFGGAVGNERSVTTFENCLFAGNRAYDDRYSFLSAASREIGALQSDAGGPMGSNPAPMLTRRGWGGAGGAILNAYGGSLTLTSCTVVDNSSDSRGGITAGADCSCTFVNCILWGNSELRAERPSQIPDRGVYVSYCCIQNPPKDMFGTGNISVDPAFARRGRWADPNDPTQDSKSSDLDAQWIDGDYHLLSQGGRWDPDTEGWVSDEATSPCVDAGDPNSPVGNEPQPNGGRINLGVYSGTIEASKSSLGEAIVGEALSSSY